MHHIQLSVKRIDQGNRSLLKWILEFSTILDVFPECSRASDPCKSGFRNSLILKGVQDLELQLLTAEDSRTSVALCI